VGTLNAKLTLNDSDATKRSIEKAITYTEKKELTVHLIDTDGTISFTFSEIAAAADVAALLITSAVTDGISATINGQAVLVDSLMFTHLTALTSLTLSTTDTTGGNVTVTIWTV
tara:strand:+ start:299 stop:640 length:342 start_codon:yes stop_codon:yes gene_type:complete